MFNRCQERPTSQVVSIPPLILGSAVFSGVDEPLTKRERVHQMGTMLRILKGEGLEDLKRKVLSYMYDEEEDLTGEQVRDPSREEQSVLVRAHACVCARRILSELENRRG